MFHALRQCTNSALGLLHLGSPTLRSDIRLRTRFRSTAGSQRADHLQVEAPRCDLMERGPSPFEATEAVEEVWGCCSRLAAHRRVEPELVCPGFEWEIVLRSQWLPSRSNPKWVRLFIGLWNGADWNCYHTLKLVISLLISLICFSRSCWVLRISDNDDMFWYIKRKPCRYHVSVSGSVSVNINININDNDLLMNWCGIVSCVPRKPLHRLVTMQKGWISRSYNGQTLRWTNWGSRRSNSPEKKRHSTGTVGEIRKWLIDLPSTNEMLDGIPVESGK